MKENPKPASPKPPKPQTLPFFNPSLPHRGGIKGLSSPKKPPKRHQKAPEPLSLLAPLWGSPQCPPVWPHSPPRMEPPRVAPTPNLCAPTNFFLFFFFGGFPTGQPGPKVSKSGGDCPEFWGGFGALGGLWVEFWDGFGSLGSSFALLWGGLGGNFGAILGSSLVEQTEEFWGDSGVSSFTLPRRDKKVNPVTSKM